MSVHLGLDIGAASLKLAALGEPGDNQDLALLCTNQSSFRLLEWDGRPLVISEYRRLSGSPIQAAYDLLQEFYDGVPESRVEGLRVTGSGSRMIAKLLGIYFENEFKAIARMIAAFHPDVRTVFEIGGESSKYLRLASGGILDYDRSGECAAGTGSFLDQQALRMGYAVEEVGEVVLEASRSARIAGRCSVFAKSDMIHAQQKGYTPSEILRGLCEAVPRNFKSSVVKCRPVMPPVAFIGAVAQNGGLVAALRKAFDLAPEELFVPDLYAWCGAIGTAILESEDRRRRSFGDIHRLHQHETGGKLSDCTPLSMENVRLLRGQAAPYLPPPEGMTIPAYLGLDIGSVSTNVVVLDEDLRLVHEVYLRTAGRPIEAVEQGLQEVKQLWGGRLRILGVGATGSGRELIAEFAGADVVNDEITAHKTGAVHISSTLGGEPVDTIFEIGGQDSKFIAIEDGVVVDFAMNDACAAGTGSFLEEQAEKLGVRIKEEFARLALSSRTPARLGERCTVFMEREVTERRNQGETIPDLLAGLSYSIALNYLNRVVRGRRIGNVIYFQGGTAYNDAVAAAFAGALGKRITVPPHNGVIGAIGMAIIARQWRLATGQESRFRGYDLSRLEISSREFVCKACTNECDIKEFSIEGKKSHWGDKCSDRYRKASVSARRPVVEDLFAFREKLLEEITGQPLDTPPRRQERLLVGIPRTMATFDRYPFWHGYLAALGVDAALSPATDPRIAAEGVEIALAQPCFPIQVAHGHVLSLIRTGADYVLAPNVLDQESDGESGCTAHMCPWNQTLPFVLRSAPKLEEHAHRLLTPTVHFQLGPRHVKESLAEMAGRLGARRRTSDAAVDAAYAAQRDFQDRLLDAGRRALAALDETGEPGLLLVGRSYNLYDRNINCDVPRKLRRNYGANVIPLDFLATGREPVSDLHPNMYWASGRKILEAARIASRRPNLHIIYISNFKCGPDSYIKHFAREAAGVPLLVLQFDGHGNDAGYMTRCEAYLDSKGILRCYNSPRRKAEQACKSMAAGIH